MTEREEEQQELGNRLREAREYRGYSQKEIAEVLEISRAAVSLIENGERKIDSIELQQLADFYNISIDELVGESPNPSETDEEVQLLTRAAKDLSAEDREELLRFVEFLRSRSSGNQSDD